MTITRTGTFPVRDAAGRMLDLGAVKHVLEWNPAASVTLPSWLATQGAGTFTAVSKSAGKPGLNIQGTSTSSPAQVVLSEAVSLARLNGLLFEVIGVESLTAVTTPGNYVLGATKAAALTTAVGAQAVVYQNAALPARMQLGSPVVDVETNYSPVSSTLLNQNMFKGVSSGILVDFTRKQFYLLEGDQFVGRMNGSTAMLLPGGESITPAFSFRPGAVGDQVHVSGVRATLWYD